jgi:hypothetical protein
VQNYKKENTEYYLYILNENKNGKIILNNTDIISTNNINSVQITEKPMELDK